MQQDESKQIIPKRISYRHSFERYKHKYLSSFLLEEIHKFDMLFNKNSKYLLYKFNDWIESMNAEKILIRHTSKVKDEVGLQKIEEKDKQFLIEKNIPNIEKEKKKIPCKIEVEKVSYIMLEIEKNYRICRLVYQSLLIEIADTFIQYINNLSPDKIDQLDDDIRSNGYGAQSIVEIESSVELLRKFLPVANKSL